METQTYTYWHVDFTNHECAIVYAVSAEDAKRAAVEQMARSYGEIVVAELAYKCLH